MCGSRASALEGGRALLLGSAHLAELSQERQRGPGFQIPSGAALEEFPNLLLFTFPVYYPPRHRELQSCPLKKIEALPDRL